MASNFSTESFPLDVSSISRLSLVGAIIVFGNSMARAIIPPNPNLQKGWKTDRIGLLANTAIISIFRNCLIALLVLHGALVYTLPDPPELLCPHVDRLNPRLFTWNALTAVCLSAAILVGAPLRLGAYNGLGKNFTYALAAPDKLTTDGIYKYIQHPSYTGLAIVAAPTAVMFTRWDGAAACWMPAFIYDWLAGWGTVTYVIAIILILQRVAMRVQDEEAMLREVFGTEWEKWHCATARFIPKIF